MSESVSLQQLYAPSSICFGCGPANQQGLHINSFVEGDRLIAEFQPLPQHQAFAGVVSGGIVGTLMDCHCNWMACWSLMQAQQLDTPPCTVTANYHIKLNRPTPSTTTLRLEAWLIDCDSSKARTAGQIIANDTITASCEGLFIAVKQGHPAYHRW